MWCLTLILNTLIRVTPSFSNISTRSGRFTIPLMRALSTFSGPAGTLRWELCRRSYTDGRSSVAPSKLCRPTSWTMTLIFLMEKPGNEQAMEGFLTACSNWTSVGRSFNTSCRLSFAGNASFV